MVLFRLPLATEKQLKQIPGAGDVTPAYMLRAFAKEARAELRRLLAEDDLTPYVDEAKRIFTMAATDMAVGESDDRLRPRLHDLGHAYGSLVILGRSSHELRSLGPSSPRSRRGSSRRDRVR